MPETQRAMKVTTVRFGADLWALLDGEAARAGVSVSQYIREAALARAAAAAAARGEEPLALLAGSRSEPRPVPGVPSDRARRNAREQVSDARAIKAESEQAVRHAHEVKVKSEDTVRSAHEHRAETGHRD